MLFCFLLIEAANPSKTKHPLNSRRYSIINNKTERTMSEEHDDDHDYAIESTDAGASDTIPMEAGSVKKGG